MTRRPGAGWLALVVLLPLALYVPTLTHGFIDEWDDDWLVTSNPRLAQPSWGLVLGSLDPTLDLGVWGAEYLPLRNASLWLDRWVWGFEPAGYHLTNVLLHAAATAALLLLLCRMGLPPGPAAVGALAFAVHPLLTEHVAWVTGRKSCLAVLFATLGGWAWARGRERGWRGGVLPAALLAAAVLSKATALAVPALYVAIDLAAPARARGRGRSLLGPYVPVTAATAALTALQLYASGKSGTIGGAPYGADGTERLAAVAGFLWHYARLTLAPTGLVIPYPWSHRLLPATALTDPAALAGLAVALALTLGTGWAVARRVRALRAGARSAAPAIAALIWWPAALLPVLNLLVPIPRAFAARYAALATIAVGFAVAAGVRQLAARRPRAALPVAGLLLAALAITTAVRLPDWRDSRSLWEASVRRAPGNPLALGKLAQSLDRDWRAAEGPGAGRDRDRAEALYRQALTADPRDPLALTNLAAILLATGRDTDAEPLLVRAVAEPDAPPEAFLNLGRRRAAQRRWREARSLAHAAIEASNGGLADAYALLKALEGKE